MQRIKIAQNIIGEGKPCFIIAEAGINHNGRLTLAKKMVEAAAWAGADAVKFQSFFVQRLLSKKLFSAQQYARIKGWQLSQDKQQRLLEHAKKLKILFLSTAFDEESADLLEGLGVAAFKIGSGDLDNFPLIRHIARKGRPIILSTGMSTMQEVKAAANVIRKEKNQDLVLLHCVSSYPAKVQDVNLRAIQTLKRKFHLPVGYSDHTSSTEISLAAVALGACVLEKHFTLKRSLPGPDQRASLEPQELKIMIQQIRNIEEARGDGIKRPKEMERKNRCWFRKSIVAKQDILKGRIITPEMLAMKRPGIGLQAKDLPRVVGRCARVDITADELVTLANTHPLKN